MTVIPAIHQGMAYLERRKKKRPKADFHTNVHKVDLSDPKKRAIFIGVCVGLLVFILFIVGLSIYLRKAWMRKKEGKKPRWGRAILKALAVATFLWIPIWIVKKIRNKRKSKVSYNKLDEAGMQPQAAWYGGNATSHAYVGAGTALHDPKPADPAAGAGLSYSYYSGQDLNAPQQPYDNVYGHTAVPTGYVAPKYDPPASLPDDGRRSVSPAPPPYHQPPSPEMQGSGAPVQTDSGAWNPPK